MPDFIENMSNELSDLNKEWYILHSGSPKKAVCIKSDLRNGLIKLKIYRFWKPSSSVNTNFICIPGASKDLWVMKEYFKEYFRILPS